MNDLTIALMLGAALALVGVAGFELSALAAVALTAPLGVAAYLGLGFIYGCKQGFTEAFRVALKDARR